jgi:hypothetical protein
MWFFTNKPIYFEYKSLKYGQTGNVPKMSVLFFIENTHASLYTSECLAF